MATAGGKKSSQFGQVLVWAVLGYFLALLLILEGPRLPGRWQGRVPLVLTHPDTSNITSPCSKNQPSLDAQADAVSVEAPNWPSTLPPAPWPFTGVQGFYAESDVTLSQWCNDTFSRQPLTAADYDGAYTPGGPCSMPGGLLETLESGSRELMVTVVGGSMTHGSGCYEGPVAGCQRAEPMKKSATANGVHGPAG